jgi:ABC-type antimicrobial peptide transport system permease subunit
MTQPSEAVPPGSLSASYASAVLGVIVLGLIAAAAPAWRASRSDPAEALRGG